jgi:hypothetical protein
LPEKVASDAAHGSRDFQPIRRKGQINTFSSRENASNAGGPDASTPAACATLFSSIFAHALCSGHRA